MTKKQQHKSAGRGTLWAILIVIPVGFYLFYGFTAAARDGMSWKRASDRAMVAPDFEEVGAGKGRQIPNFTLPDRYGNPVSLDQFDGVDILLVNIWSSGCPACEREIPSLSEMDRRLAELGNVALLTIAADEGWKEVAHYFPGGTDLRVLFDPEGKVTEKLFGTKLFPETFVLDGSRRIRARFDGERQWHTREMFEFLDAYL